MKEIRDIAHLDWALESDEELYDSLWREHVLCFTPGGNTVFLNNDLLDEDELYELAMAYDIAMAEEGENITWDEYLKEQAEDY